MGYFGSEVTRLLGGQCGDIIGGYNIVNRNGQQVLVDGVTRLLTIEGELVRVQAGRAVVAINGRGLRIVEAAPDSVLVGGQITSTEVTQI